MNRQEHCKECEEKLGRSWDMVHAWLDEYAPHYKDSKGRILMVHRIKRHHEEGVEEVRAMWGDQAAEAAKLHIISDEGKLLSARQMYKRYGLM